MYSSDILHTLLLLTVFPVLLLQCNRVDSDREANRLFVEAYQLTEEAIALQNEDPIAASRKYRKALNNIEKIIQDYSETEVAVNVTQQQTRIGELTIGELRDRVPRYEKRAAALDNFDKLVRYLISLEEDDVIRAEKYMRLARWAFQNENHELFQDLMQEVRQRAERHWSIQVSDPVYVQLVTGYTESEQWDKAMETIELIQGRTQLYRALDTIISGGLIRHKDSEPLAFITGFVDYLSPTQQIEILSLTARELFETEQFDQAVALAEHDFSLPDEQNLLDHIEALIDLAYVYSSQGAFDTSREIIQLISELDDNYADFALRDLATELARRRNTNEALEVIQSFDQEYFRHATLSAVSIQVARNGMVSKALSLLDEIPDGVTEFIESHIEIAFILSEYEDHDRADSLLDHSWPLIKEMESALHRSQTIIRVADIYLLRDERSKVAEILNEAENHARHISGSGNVNQIMADIFTRWIRIGRPDRALDLATNFHMDHDTFEELIITLLTQTADSGYYDLARTLSGMTERQHYYLNQLNTIYLEQRDLNRATSLSYDIRNYFYRAHALADLSDAFTREGRFDEAMKAATDALQTIQRIREAGEHRTALEYVASRLAAAGLSMDEEQRSISATLLQRFELP